MSDSPAAQAVRLLKLRTEIEYSIIALGLSAKESAEIIKDSTGVAVDAKAPGFLQTLDISRLEAIWKRLAVDGRWKLGRRER